MTLIRREDTEDQTGASLLRKTAMIVNWRGRRPGEGRRRRRRGGVGRRRSDKDVKSMDVKRESGVLRRRKLRLSVMIARTMVEL